MPKQKILITGINGLLGSALVKIPFENYDLVFLKRTHGDLTDRNAVEKIYQTHCPNIVIHAAAKVGGIKANFDKSAEFFYENILMNTHMIHCAAKYHVDKFIAFSSVCAFDGNETLYEESKQQDGIPHYTNFAYAYAKRMIDVQFRAYAKSDTKFINLILSNMYGINDNFGGDSHVIPALIHKAFLAKKYPNQDFVVWGDGTARREFVYSKDVARIVEQLVEKDIDVKTMIVSSGNDISIKDIVDIIIKRMPYDRDVKYDTTQLVGQKVRRSNNTVFRTHFPDFQFTSYEDGLNETIDWFKIQYPDVRL